MYVAECLHTVTNAHILANTPSTNTWMELTAALSDAVAVTATFVEGVMPAVGEWKTETTGGVVSPAHVPQSS